MTFILTTKKLNNFHAMASQQKDSNRVIGGLKAAAHNPKFSDEAKAKASQRLQEMGGQQEVGSGRQVDEDDNVGDEDFEEDSTSAAAGGGESNRVLGGYKATLKNPRVSGEAKEHAEQVLKDNDAM
ncbi:Conidiation-specific protein 6 [Hypsizygus marmoreus]|uniref:Conidiation-specific protein 6 n=1 Tax=Hypsizygus marmoreus TaxID=39966 RepID=A0A369JJY2_HYPMA|nr:Conidiation-specific protein 6 [Hypsizygus marmoreus]